MSGTDVVIVGQGPAGLLLSSLVVESGGSVTLIAGSQGTMPLWGGHWDFRSYTDQGQPVRDPYAWWRSEIGRQHEATWRSRWQHLAVLWQAMEIPVSLSADNRWLMTPLGHLRPTFLAPEWHFTATEPDPVTLIQVPGLVDFNAESAARVYEWVTGKPADVLQLGTPPAWREHWTPLNWAWYLDTDQGFNWLLNVVAQMDLPANRVVVFPQMLGVDRCEELMQALSDRTERVIREVPLPPPAVGGIRIQRRWEAWLRRQALIKIQGWVQSVRGQTVTLDNGRSLFGDRVVLATGGILGGGFRVEPSGIVKDVVLGTPVGSIEEGDVGSVGYASWDQLVPVVGRMVRGWNPDRGGDGGAMMLTTVHDVFEHLSAHRATKEGR